MKIFLLTLLFSTSVFAETKTRRIERAIVMHFPEAFSAKVTRSILTDIVPGILYPYTWWDGETHYSAKINVTANNTLGQKTIKCEVRAFFSQSKIKLFCEGNSEYNETIEDI